MDQISRLKNDFVSAKQHISSLEAQIDDFRSFSKQAQLEEETSQLKADLERYQLAHEGLMKDKMQLEGDLDGSCDALEIVRQQHEKELIDSIAKERAKLKRSEASLKILAKLETSAQDRVSDLEQQKDALEIKLHKAEERNGVTSKTTG